MPFYPGQSFSEMQRRRIYEITIPFEQVFARYRLSASGSIELDDCLSLVFYSSHVNLRRCLLLISVYDHVVGFPMMCDLDGRVDRLHGSSVRFVESCTGADIFIFRCGFASLDVELVILAKGACET